LKILMCLTYYHPHWTGLTAYAKRLAEGLARRGHQVTVVTSQFDRSLPREETYQGVRILRLAAPVRLSRGQVQPSFLPVVRRLVREHDVVQVHTPMLETWLVGALAHQAGRKMLMTHHGDLVMPSGLSNQFVQMTVGFLQNRGARSADVISIHSQDYADHSEYLKPYASKVVAIYPPVEIPRPDAAAVAAWRQELGLDSCKLVGFAGRFVEEKGFDYLIRAIPRVLARLPGCKFAYAGDPNVVYEHFFQQCLSLFEPCREHVVMLGLIRDPQKLANFYAMCDVFCVPSRTDCFPSVQLEALQCGTPLVTADIPGAREVVLATGMGLLVAPRDEQALADGLVRVLSDRAAYVKPYEAIRAVFNIERSVVAYEQLLQSMVS
jgi:glycosyltransferase involved in cell wall biosynthesis